jgi:hypothetical protein
MASEDMKKKALIINTRLYEWMVMLFGLKNVTNIFTRTMLEVFKELGNKFLKVFVDDLNVHNKSWEKHFQHLDVVFLKLKEVNLKLNPSKCCFVAKSVTFLGHVVSNKGTKLDPGKNDVVMHFLKLKMVTTIRSFSGLIGYYQNYVWGYSRLVVPLFELRKKEVDFIWDLGCQQAFEALKKTLVDALVFICPNFKKQFCLDVD